MNPNNDVFDVASARASEALARKKPMLTEDERLEFERGFSNGWRAGNPDIIVLRGSTCFKLGFRQGAKDIIKHREVLEMLDIAGYVMVFGPERGARIVGNRAFFDRVEGEFVPEQEKEYPDLAKMITGIRGYMEFGIIQ